MSARPDPAAGLPVLAVSPPSAWPAVGLLAALVVLMRVVFSAGFIGSDDLTYARMAQGLLDGHLINEARALRFGASVPLAVSFAIFGFGALGEQVVHHIAALISTVLLFRLCADCFGRRAALYCAGLFAVFTPIAGPAVTFFVDDIGVAFLLAGALALRCGRLGSRLGWVAMGGLLLACACAVRDANALFLPAALASAGRAVFRPRVFCALVLGGAVYLAGEASLLAGLGQPPDLRLDVMRRYYLDHRATPIEVDEPYLPATQAVSQSEGWVAASHASPSAVPPPARKGGAGIKKHGPFDALRVLLHPTRGYLPSVVWSWACLLAFLTAWIRSPLLRRRLAQSAGVALLAAAPMAVVLWRLGAGTPVHWRYFAPANLAALPWLGVALAGCRTSRAARVTGAGALVLLVAVNLAVLASTQQQKNGFQETAAAAVRAARALPGDAVTVYTDTRTALYMSLALYPEKRVAVRNLAATPHPGDAELLVFNRDVLSLLKRYRDTRALEAHMDRDWSAQGWSLLYREPYRPLRTTGALRLRLPPSEARPAVYGRVSRGKTGVSSEPR